MLPTRTAIPRVFCLLTLGTALTAGPLAAAVTSPVGPQDFGQTNVHPSSAVTKTIAYTFTGLAAAPSFSLAYGRDFSAHAPVCSGTSSCSVAVDFAPYYPGPSQDALLLKDAGGNVIAATTLHGIGLGPQSSFHPGIITAFAGTGAWGYSGDGSAARNAKLAHPQGIAVDPLGSLYVADSINQVVRKIDQNGIITTVAGNGVAGLSPDGTAATQAMLNTPVSVALDAAGNLYIADSGNNLIRKVNAATGLISTVAGGGTTASQSDHIGDGGLATAAILSGPADICLDFAGNLYIADSFHGLVRKVDTSGVITIFAGGGSGTGSDGVGDGLAATSAVLATPSGLTTDGQGNLYIADSGHNMIRFVQVASGIISAVAGSGIYGYGGDSGAASAAYLADPQAIRLDAAGDLFIADYGNNVVREVFAGTGVIKTVAGTGRNGHAGDNGSPLSAQLANPMGVALDGLGNLFIADYANDCVRKVAFNLQNLAFNTTYVGQASTPQIETLFNAGNHSLTVSGLNLSRGFTQQSSGAVDCAVSASVLPGANCVLSLALYSTAAAGNVTGTLTVTTNSLNQVPSVKTASLSGITVAATSTLRVSSTQLSFGSQGVGTTGTRQTVTLTNTGTAALSLQSMWVAGANAASFQISNNQCALTLAAQAQCTLQIAFAPVVAGSNTGTVMYAYAGAPTVSTNVSGTATSAQAAVLPATLSFGSTGVGLTSPAQTVMLTNTSSAVLALTGVALSNAADFSIASNGCSSAIQPQASCTVSITFTPATAGARSGTLSFTDSGSGTAQSVTLSGSATPALEYIPMTPCRMLDTRGPTGTWGGPSMPGNTTRTFPITASSCNVPSTAAAYFLTVTVVPHGQLGYLTLWPAGQPQPNVSTLNSDGRIKANAAIVPAGTNGSISVYVTNTTDVLLDISGYFVPKGTPNALAFYPMVPCRLVETRQGITPLGGPKLPGQQGRAFPILASACGVPATARAYSLNYTAIPDTQLGYVTAWPTGQPQPNTSILNSLTGAVTAVASLTPAGTDGDISVYADKNSNLVVDINGYFAPPGPGGYSYYNVTPCRVLESRAGGALPIASTTTVDVAGSACAPPAAQAYLLNVTVIPPGGLGYITVWPYGQSQPNVSTLNATDGAVTSNMAIVPASQGKVDFYGSAPTHAVIDIAGFFD